MLSHIVYYNDDSLLIHCTETDLSLYKLEYFTEFYFFQARTWRLTMCVCVRVYLVLLSHSLPFKIHLTNISPILIKMVDFKNLAWATTLLSYPVLFHEWLPAVSGNAISRQPVHV